MSAEDFRNDQDVLQQWRVQSTSRFAYGVSRVEEGLIVMVPGSDAAGEGVCKARACEDMDGQISCPRGSTQFLLTCLHEAVYFVVR
jgi:hypothetical protein